MREALGRDPGLRVAILDYFVNVSRELRNPKIIEISMYERTERSAVSDGLTGLYNHAYLLQALRQEVLRSKRHGLKAALLLLDLDDFKRVNDERGHVEGDRVLMKAAAIVRDSVREIDVAARYGGEEFAVLLPGHLAPRGVRGGRADPAPGRGALRARPDPGHALRAGSRSSPTTRARPPT